MKIFASKCIEKELFFKRSLSEQRFKKWLLVIIIIIIIIIIIAKRVKLSPFSFLLLMSLKEPEWSSITAEDFVPEVQVQD